MILLSSLVLINACSGFGPKKVAPLQIEPIKFEETKVSNVDVPAKIKELKDKIGKSPTPIIVDIDGKKYAAFTAEQLKKLTATNEFAKYLENLALLQHEQIKLQITEINQLKRIANLQYVETNSVNRLYTQARNDANSERFWRNIEGYGYKILMIGQLILIFFLI